MRNKITIKDGDYIENNPESTPPDSRDINILEMLAKVLRYKKIILIFVFGIMALATVKVILAPNIYQSQATLLPSGKVDKLAQLKQLAGFGGVIAGDDNSSELFPVVLRSQLIRDAVLNKTYSFQDKGKKMSMTLAEYLGDTNPDILRLALQNMTSIGKNSTGVIEINVSTIYPELSQAVTREYITQLENYNRNKRHSQARENEQYLAGQIELTKQNLADAENKLEQFQLVNLDWALSSDPTTLKEMARLQRDAEARTKALLFLMQEHEIAQQEVHKDIPIVRVLDEPNLPVLKSGPHRKITVFLSGFVALMAAIFAVLLAEAINKKRRGPDRHSYDYLCRSFADAFPRTDRVANRMAHIAREKIKA